MIPHKLHIGGVEVDLTLPKADIEATINANQAKCYPNGLVVAEYQEIDERTAEITFSRTLPRQYYGAINGCLGQIDCAIVSGLLESCFMIDLTGKHKPLCGPLIPWGNGWFIPDAAFASFYRQFNETMVKEKISRVRFIVGPNKISVIVKYPRAKGKYDDDVADLESELGDTLENRRGQTLSFKLYDLGQICQRPQIKVKSYMGLKSFLLKTFDITLEIL